MKNICVIGLGYIGIPTALVFAANNFTIWGVDVDKTKVDSINNKIIPFHETEVDTFSKPIFQNNIFTAGISVRKADVFIICVSTPLKENKNECDLRYVQAATESIVPCLQKDNLVILESTVPPRTCEDLVIPILEKSGLKVTKDFYFAHCPERLLPGNIIYEIIYNDRIIGGIDKKSTDLAFELYSSFVKGSIFKTNTRTAEMCKLMENTYRDVNIALANELLLICEKLDINIYEAINIANKHPRVKILQPGPGVGGHCLPKDPWLIYEMAPEISKLLKTARLINKNMPNEVVKNIIKIDEKSTLRKISLWGVSYKGNVDDPRDSPSYDIFSKLVEHGFTVSVFDPIVNNGNLKLDNLENSVTNADLILIITDHDVFNNQDLFKIRKKMNKLIVFDTRNFIFEDKWKVAGFKIYKFGTISR